MRTLSIATISWAVVDPGRVASNNRGVRTGRIVDHQICAC